MMIRSCLPAFLLCALVASPVFAQVNDNAANAERMNRLERDLMLLQRQVARGDAPASPGAPTPLSALPPSSSADVEVHLSRIEEELRKLSGKLEESDFRNNQLNERLEKLQKDVDYRFGELGAAKTAGAADAPATPAPAQPQSPQPPQPKPEAAKPHPITTPLSAAAKPDEAPQSETEELNRMVEEISGESSVPKEEEPENNAAAAPAAAPTQTSGGDGQLKPPSESKQGPREQYNTAFKLLNQTKYDEAAAQFNDFTQKYPKDPLVGNAFYWLGETHYIRRDYVKAADSFRQGFEAMPTGPKAADNLLKLSMSLSAMQKTKESCVVLDQILVKFNKTSAVVTQKAQQERARLGCK